MIPTLIFDPIYQERVWGGRVLEDFPGRRLPPEVPVGESWDVVDRPEAVSVVAEGPWRGKTLRELLEADPFALMGPGWTPERRFPILVKWLDCAERLSLQVHPPAGAAAELGGEPKTENWFIAAARPGAGLLVGLKKGVTEEGFRAALEQNRLEACAHRFPVEPGQSILVRSGQIHAIDGGNLILEIQQNSDTTYRVYDWGRVGLDGKPRTLHVEESLASIDFSDFEPEPLPAVSGDRRLAECPEFVIDQREWNAGQTVAWPPNEQPRLLHLVHGRLRSVGEGPDLEAGRTALIPYAAKTSWVVEEAARALVTEAFAG